MKLYKTDNRSLIRAVIKKENEQTYNIAFKDCTLNSCLSELTIILDSFSIMAAKETVKDTKKVQIILREYNEGKNGKAKSLSYKGLTTTQINNLILKIYGN